MTTAEYGLQRFSQQDRFKAPIQVALFRHIIDLDIHPDKQEFLYEETCMGVLDTRLGENDIAIGPHLIDYMFDRSRILRGKIRPDCMVFSEKNHHWTLRTLIEIKSSGSRDMTRKSQGFESMLRIIRANPNKFRKELFEYIDPYFREPNRIVIPEPARIDLVYIHPFPNGAAHYYGDMPFPVSYMRIPAEQ